MKYANYDKTNGKLLGWYDSEIHGTIVPEVPEILNEDGTVKTKAIPSYYDVTSIPTPNAEVSEEDWQEAIDNGYNYVDATKKTLSKKDFRTFTELQTSKMSELETGYNISNTLDIAYMDTTFQADKKSQDLIVSVLSAGSVPDEFYWMDKANNQVDMTFTDLQGLSSAILVRSQINFVKLQGLKTDVRNATTQDDLDKITW